MEENSTYEQNTGYAEYDTPYVTTSTAAITKDINFKDFYKNYCSSTTKKNINGAAIALYICSGFTLVVSIAAIAFGLDIFAGALDAIVMLCLALGIHIGKSRVCSVIVLVYSIINLMFSMATTGRPSGWLIIIAGIYATIYTLKAHKEYKEYING